MKLITSVIEQLVKKWGKSAYDINNGQCIEFALAVISRVKGATDVCTENFVEFGDLPGHCWIMFRGRHYDAETPHGVSDFRDLPIFKKALRVKV